MQLKPIRNCHALCQTARELRHNRASACTVLVVATLFGSLGLRRYIIAGCYSQPCLELLFKPRWLLASPSPSVCSQGSRSGMRDLENPLRLECGSAVPLPQTVTMPWTIWVRRDLNRPRYNDSLSYRCSRPVICSFSCERWVSLGQI